MCPHTATHLYKQVLEACKLVGCAGDARLEALLSVLLARCASVPEIAAAALAGLAAFFLQELKKNGGKIMCTFYLSPHTTYCV
jgi:hypothetical protein